MSKREVKKCISFCKENFFGYSDAFWHRAYYGINGIWSLDYIPEHFFYNELEDYLNPISAKLPYMDKNNFDRLFPDIQKPKTIIRKIDGEYYDENYKSCLVEDILKINAFSTVIVKPTINSSSGRGVVRIDFKDLINYLTHEKCPNLIVQELINQHKEIALFNKTSVNSIRISTLKIKTNAKLCSAYLRLGRKDLIVDNNASGGLSVGINSDGTLKEYAFNRKNNYSNHKTHLDSNVEFINFKIPSWNKLTKAVISLHDSTPGLRFLSWDMSIDEIGEPVLIEVNVGSQGINGHQFSKGPLFGDLTEEVLDWYKKQRNNKPQPFIQIISRRQ